MALVFNFGTSDNLILNALQHSGGIWSDDGIRYDPVTVNYFFDNTVKTWEQFEKDAYHDALQSWANVANIGIHEVTVEGQADLIELLVSSLTIPGAGADHEFPDSGVLTQATGRYAYDDGAWVAADLHIGGLGYWNIVHELGHGLGLGHPFDTPPYFPGLVVYPAADRQNHTGDNGLDQMYFTVMSYRSTPDPATANVDKTVTTKPWDPNIYSYGYISGPMALDIAAIQNLYGPNLHFNEGDNIYYLPDTDKAWSAAGPATSWTCIWDTGGANAIAYTGTKDATIDLRAATLDNSPTGGGTLSWAHGVHGGFSIANGVHVDSAYGGSGNDTLIGNASGNIIDGGRGADTMRGGGGDDVYEVDNVGDVVVENANEGAADRIDSYISIDQLAANVENLVLYGDSDGGPDPDLYAVGNALSNVFNGNNGNNALYGLGGSDTIYGYGGNDKLDGGNGGEADQMYGGNGDDIYEVDSVGDVVVENPNEGTADRFDSYISIDALPANVENIVLYGTGDLYAVANDLPNAINGTNGKNSLYGLGGSDTIYGYGGNDKLDGGNGGEADQMYGGDGDDIYEVDSIGDVVVENANEGTADRVDSYISWTLGANIEDLVLYGATNINGTGNGLANAFSGNNGNNVLSGLGGIDQVYGYGGNDTLDGGTGADVMVGGTGNDSYFIDNAGDVVTENVNEGSDTVYSAIDLTLVANVENLTLQGAALQGYGNAIVNALYGTSGNNTLDGKAGADLMVGGAGNDSYFVDNGGDVLVENANEGSSDIVYSTASLHLGANIENLVMQGSADLQGFGNNVANAIYGNSGSNILDGDVGADLMVGGLGNDNYYVDNAADTITENANEGTDTVYSTAHLRLAANLENLLLQGVADLQGFGNAVSNAIYGNSGSNLLDGDAGADSLYGGVGADTYYVDNIADVVVENANEGFDTVHTTANLVLAANCETLILDGSADLQGYGNGLVNSIYGNSGSNLLDGGTGGDSMYGGAGNDIYYVDNTGDVIVENANQGTDTVFSAVDITLAANVEQLVMQGGAGLQGYGNSLSNALYGNSGANLLNGGAAADSLTGNSGNDTFVFNVGQGNGDTIVDFAGNGAAAGDALLFVGFGAGANLTNIDATHWQVNYNGGASHDVITFSNAASINAQDFNFI